MEINSGGADAVGNWSEVAGGIKKTLYICAMGTGVNG